MCLLEYKAITVTCNVCTFLDIDKIHTQTVWNVVLKAVMRNGITATYMQVTSVAKENLWLHYNVDSKSLLSAQFYAD